MEQDEKKDLKFLTNHAFVLSWLDQHPKSTARETASAIGIAQRTVSTIIGALYGDGYLTRRCKGRRNEYSVIEKMPMRHMSTIPDVPVESLLRVMSTKKKQLAPEA